MGTLELEFRQDRFESLALLLASIGPNPFPTLTGLGDERLIRSLSWSSLEVGLAPPGFTAPPGSLPARAALSISHVSIAELDADPFAVGASANATGWLLITAAAGPATIAVSIVGIDLANAPPQRFTPPAMLYSRPISGLDEAGVTAGAALLLREHVVTLRFASDPADDILATTLNMLNGRFENQSWLIRLTPGLLTSRVLKQISDGLNPLPDGLSIEDAPTASWTQIDGTWQVMGSVGINKADACKGVLWDTSISITIDVTLTPSFGHPPDSEAIDRIDLTLRLSSDPSDWDSFRCWLGKFGFASIGIAFIDEPVGFLSGIASLILVADTVGSDAGAEVAKTDLGADFTKVASDEASATYLWSIPFARLRIEGGSIGDWAIDADGITLTGQVFYVAATHSAEYSPDAPNLKDAWRDDFNCRDMSWHAVLAVQGVSVSDTAVVAGSSATFPVPVTVFATSAVAPALRWRLVRPTEPDLNPYVTVQARAAPDSLSHETPPGTTGQLYLHTSAGIRRYDINGVPAHNPPTELMQTLAAFQCRQWIHRWTRFDEIPWLVDPPDWDHGFPPLRQWLITLREVAAGAGITVRKQRNGRQYGTPISFVASRGEGASVEIVTDATTGLTVEYSGHAAPEARLAQRWLLPLQVRSLSASRDANQPALGKFSVTTQALSRSSVNVAAMAALMTRAKTDVLEGDPLPPYCMNLRGGKVVALWEDKLVVAIPWGPQ